MRKTSLVLAIVLVIFAAFYWPYSQHSASAHEDVVNVYTSRKEQLLKDLFKQFEQQTGIRVNYVVDKPSKLIARMKHEEANSPADVFLTADIVNLEIAKQEGMLQPISSPALRQSIPPQFQDENNQWFGLSRRARIIAYHRDRVTKSDIQTYEDLAKPKWKGRVLIRSSNNVYNQSLIASVIAAHGVDKAQEWANGIVENMARTPQGGDTDQLRAVAAGQGDVAVVNNYYFERLRHSDNPEDQKVVEDLRVIYPNQPSTDIVDVMKHEENPLWRGTHINISGGGVTKNAEHVENAVKLLEFLSGDKAQEIYANGNYEFPIKPATQRVMGTQRDAEEHVFDDIKLQQLHSFHKDAIKIADRAGWR